MQTDFWAHKLHMGIDACEHVKMKGIFTPMDNSARGMYICTRAVMHTSIPLDLCSYAPMHMTRHRCVQMFHVCPECRCSQVPVDEH